MALYSRGGNSGNPHMYHLYIHMFGPLVLTKISFTSCLSLTFIAFIGKTSPFDFFFNDLLDIIVSILFLPHFPFLSFAATASHNPWPRVPDSTHMTWKPWGAWPPYHRTNRGLKTKDLGPFGRRNGPGPGQTLQQLSEEKTGTILKWSSSLK